MAIVRSIAFLSSFTEHDDLSSKNDSFNHKSLEVALHTFRMFLSLLASENGTHEGNVLNQWKENLVQLLYPLCCKHHVPSK